MYSSHGCHVCHLLLCNTLQLKAHPTTCQKSCAFAQTELALANSALILFRSSFVGLPSSPVVLLRAAPRRDVVPTVENAKASCRVPLIGPARLRTKRRYFNARIEACRRSSVCARVVRDGWIANVAAKASCSEGGRKAGRGGSEVVPNVSSEIRLLSAGTSSNVCQ